MYINTPLYRKASIIGEDGKPTDRIFVEATFEHSPVFQGWAMFVIWEAVIAIAMIGGMFKRRQAPNTYLSLNPALKRPS
jgi:hypothetical protein